VEHRSAPLAFKLLDGVPNIAAEFASRLPETNARCRRLPALKNLDQLWRISVPLDIHHILIGNVAGNHRSGEAFAGNPRRVLC
jgi:hypothetical protein